MPISPPFKTSQSLRYRANCAALAEVDEKLARCLESEPIPAGVEAAVGRDGAETLRLTAGDGTSRWFGDSSMPTVSAEALFGQYAAGGGNVLLPGMGTGREALVLAGRLPGHCAVLIHEAQLAAIKLAFGLYDYADLIGQRRLVFCTGPELGQALADLFVAMPGLEFPVQLLPLPGHDAATTQRMRLTIEATGQQVQAQQAMLAGEAGRRLAEHSADPTSQAPRLCVISRDPRPEASHLVARIVETLNGQGRPAAGCTPDRPDRCHAVARLQLLADHRPDGVLLVNCLPGPLAGCLPEDLPVCSWLTTTDSTPTNIADNNDPGRPIFAASAQQIKTLIRAGAARQQVHLLEPATDPQVFKPVTMDEAQRRRFGCDVAICADAGETGAQAANITLTSHIRLWEHLAQAVGDGIDDWTVDSARRVLRQAQRKCGVKLQDEELVERFEALVANRLAPAMAARYLAKGLAKAGLKVTLWGLGWAAEQTAGVRLGGPIDTPEDWNQVYNGAMLTVRAMFDDRAVQIVLDCLAAGGCPICPAPAGALEAAYPGLVSAISTVPQGGTPKQLLNLAKRLATDQAARDKATEPANRRILEAHTLEHRLETLWRITTAQSAPADRSVSK